MAKKQNNPWAICTARFGYKSLLREKCILNLKQKFGMHIPKKIKLNIK